MKAMKRVAEIKARREHAFWKNRSVCAAVKLLPLKPHRKHHPTHHISSFSIYFRMATAREKLRASRANKKLVTAKRDAAYVPSTQLVEPIAVEEAPKAELIK
jgi:large subunit ribosomal protein L24e